jgi:hypothetical protein
MAARAPVAPVASLPRRDGAARARLAAVGAARAPVVLARDRALALSGPLATALPSVQRGSVVAVDGVIGSGATSAVFAIAAAATAAGEWAAMIDGAGTLGGCAAAEVGVDLARFVVVRAVPRDRWATVVAALLDGVSVVVAELPRSVRVGDARRLAARARERSSVLVACATDAHAWPGEAAVRLHARGGAWTGLGAGDGLLERRLSTLEIESRGRPPRPRLELAG